MLKGPPTPLFCWIACVLTIACCNRQQTVPPARPRPLCPSTRPRALLQALVVALFARSWHFGGHGPGIMTKVKIFLTHFQVAGRAGHAGLAGHAECAALAGSGCRGGAARSAPLCLRQPPTPPCPTPPHHPTQPIQPSNQMISLFRDYDVVWPGATEAALGWFEVINVGFSMLAPGGWVC